jgi:hypothetical protein
MKGVRKPTRVRDADAVAALLLQKPWLTLAEIQRTTGVLTASKVISAMILDFNYVFAKRWKKVKRKGGGGKRRVRTYFILQSPPKPQLELTLEG